MRDISAASAAAAAKPAASPAAASSPAATGSPSAAASPAAAASPSPAAVAKPAAPAITGPYQITFLTTQTNPADVKIYEDLASAFNGTIPGVTVNGHAVTAEERLLQNLHERIRDVRQGPDGALWLLTDNSAGRILRVTPAAK